MAEERVVTLDTIAGGAVLELFRVELARVLANVNDPNTDHKTARKIGIEIVFRPNIDRDVCDVTAKCSSKLAGLMPQTARVFVGRRGGKLIAVESDPRQSTLFDPPVELGPVAVGQFTRPANTPATPGGEQ